MRKFCKEIKKGIYIKPSTPFEENYLISYIFKKCYKDKTKQEILERLIELSKVKIDINEKKYKKRRARKHRVKGKCFVCKLKNAISPHHIILLKNGGMDNIHNRISICEECHKIIHPWI